MLLKLKTRPSKTNMRRQETIKIGKIQQRKVTQVKGDAIAEALAQTLEDFTNDLQQWSEIDADTQKYWTKKGPKDCQVPTH